MSGDKEEEKYDDNRKVDKDKNVVCKKLLKKKIFKDHLRACHSTETRPITLFIVQS